MWVGHDRTARTAAASVSGTAAWQQLLAGRAAQQGQQLLDCMVLPQLAQPALPWGGVRPCSSDRLQPALAAASARTQCLLWELALTGSINASMQWLLETGKNIERKGPSYPPRFGSPTNQILEGTLTLSIFFRPSTTVPCTFPDCSL